jgi:hypothetical protein
MYGVKFKEHGWILTDFLALNGVITSPQATTATTIAGITFTIS